MMNCLTHAQKRIWYIEKIYPNTSLYNIGGTVRIKGYVDFNLLEAALNIFIKKNEGVRLQIVEQNGEGMQYVSEFKEQSIDFLDFSTYNDSIGSFEKWVEENARKPFELYEKPLFYFALFKICDNLNGYLVKFHHIIADGWSMNVMTKQICDVYSRLIKAEEVTDALEFSYLEYIEQEKKYMGSDRFKKNRDFWLEKFKSLPEHFIDKGFEGTTGRRVTFTINESMSKGIKARSLENKYSLNTFFTAAFILYIHKITQQNDIVIGTPVLNRSGQKEKRMIGMFTSTMPFRINVDVKSTLAEFMDSVNRKLMECYFNQKYPYDILVHDLELKKKGYSGLFDMCVNYYNTHLDNKLNGASIENIEFYNGNQIYALQMVIKDWAETENLTVDFDYKVDRYNEKQIQELYKRLCIIIEGFLNNSTQKISETCLLTKEERNCLLYEFNSTSLYYPKDKSVCRLFEEQASRNPDKISISFEGIELTYSELNKKASKIAGSLRDKEVGHEVIVGIMASHSIELVAGILGIMKAGGAYLPIDPVYPNDRIEFMLKDAGTKLLLTDIPDREISFGGEVVDIRGLASADSKKEFIDSDNKPGDLAYVIYTSGSTGKPKGVMVEHQGLTNYIWWAKEVYTRHENEVFALYSSISFDLTVTSIFTPLISGGMIAVYRDEGEEFILYKILLENRVSIIKLTPAHLYLLKDMDNNNSSVKRMILGGEDLKTALSMEIFKCFGGDIEIFNEYGPTETVVGCMIYKFKPEENKGVSVPVGVPAANAQIYVLDKFLNPVPVGETGEMYISGDGVARGYLGREGLTMEKFPNNPFIPGKRMYKTGDLARFLDNMNIEYLGRADRQVKLRGYRIELEEIENCLLKIDYIKDTVVTILTDSSGSIYLCAYLIMQGELQVEKITEYLSGFLPWYMIPRKFVALEQFPLTVNGKVDRNSLPVPEIDQKKSGSSFESVNGPEGEFITIVKEILQIQEIDLNDHFYQLGGDSIKAIQIASKLTEAGFKIKVKDILSNPVFGDMLKHVQVSEKLLEKKPCEGSILSTPITEWFFSKDFKNINYWNQSVLLELSEDIALGTIKNVINMIILHHDSLRINYDPPNRRLFYNPSYLTSELKVEIKDLSEYSYEEQKYWLKIIGEEIKSSFNIENKLLFGACLFDLGEQGKRLLLTAHHLVIDVVSWRIILQDIAALFEKIKNNKPLSLTKKSHSYQKWASELTSIGRDIVLTQRNYWNSCLDSTFDFPADFYPEDEYMEEKCVSERYLSEEDTRKLIFSANEAYKTEVSEILAIALSLSLGTFKKSNEIVIQLEHHGREELFENVDLTATVGWFTSIYPVSLNIEGKNISEKIKSLKEQLRQVPNKGIGFGILKYLLNDFDDKFKDEKQIRFNYLGDFNNTFANPYFKMAKEDVGEEKAAENHLEVLIDIMAMVIDGRMEIKLLYSKKRFKSDTIERFADCYMEQLKEVLEHCSNRESTEFSPSDFDAADLSQGDLDALFL